MQFREWRYMNFDQYSLKYVPKSLINIIPALVQRIVLAPTFSGRRIFWTNDGEFTDAYMRQLKEFNSKHAIFEIPITIVLILIFRFQISKKWLIFMDIPWKSPSKGTWLTN